VIVGAYAPGSMTTSGAPALVGRDREVDSVRAAIASAAGGHGEVVLLEGEPGIGKSRLVATACDHARESGFDVFVGVCDDLAAARPFAALAAALGVTPDSPDPECVAIAAVADIGDAASANPGLQYRVVEALGARVERLAERGPLLLAIDDLQWADSSTLVAVRSIARRAQTLPVVLLGSYRAGHRVAELHRVADDLLRAGATRLALAPLDDVSVASLVTDVLDASPSDDLLARVRGASWNPLFVIEYARSIAADEGAASESGAAAEFRTIVLRRLGALSEATGDALRMAAVLGATFSPADLAVATGRSIVELTSSLQQAIVSSILEDRGEHLAFRHALVRDAIYEQIPLSIRRQLHREVGRALADAGSDALTVGHHLALGAHGEDAEAVEWLRRAARDVAPRSPATAVELLERAGDLLGPVSPGRDALLAERAVALAWSGRLAEAAELGVAVLGRRPPPEIAGPLRCGLVYALTWLGKPAEAVRHAVLGADDEIGEWDAALLLAEAAVASMLAFDFPTATAQAAEARAAAERLGHDVALCHALTAQTWIALFANRFPEAAELGLRAVDIADRSTSGEAHLAHPRFFVAQPLGGLQGIEAAEEMLRSGLQIAERLGLAWSFPLYHNRLGAFAFMRGDWDTAVAECETSIAVADEVGLHVASVAVSAAWLAAMQLHRDDLDAAERTLAIAVSKFAEEGPQLGIGVINWARALVHEAKGETQEALALLQAAWDLYQAGGPITDPWSTMLHLRLRVAVGDREGAAALVPPADQPGAGILRMRAIVEQDPDALVEVVAQARQDHRNLDLAETLEDAALVLAAADRLEEAVPLWDEAIEVYEHLGASRDIARIAALLRQHGVKRGTRRRHVRATTGWDSLTATELKVVELVAQRLSNPEVAERLFISRHTVESHLKNIYRKLALSSRSQLAAEAARHS
jgi:DNA-binding CsgD family transcriptional regulator